MPLDITPTTPAVPTGPLSSPGYTISLQKITLDLNFRDQSLRGRTEITLHPLSKDLRVIRLHLRQAKLKYLSVEGRPPNVKFTDYVGGKALRLGGDGGNVHNWEMLRRKVDKVEGVGSGPRQAVEGLVDEGAVAVPGAKKEESGELVITLPKSVQVEEMDPFAVQLGAAHAAGTAMMEQAVINHPGITGPSTSKGGVAETPIAETPAIKTAGGDDAVGRFKPLQVRIEWVIEEFREGLHWVGVTEGDMRYPHVYTKNDPHTPGTAASIFPCLDDPSAKCLWEITITCPRTLGDAFRRKADASTDEDADMEDMLSEEDKARDLSVVCCGEMTDEIIDPKDSTKKSVTFAVTTPVAPRHIGFAVGPFEAVNLSAFRGTEEDDALGKHAIRVHGFCLPGRTEEVKNTCVPLAKALDFFSRAYSGYPFTSYKVLFVDDLVTDTEDTAGMSLCSNRLLFPEDILDPINKVTRTLIHALASQWVGVNITPKEATDMWVIVGIAYFMTDLFMKRLCGNNEFRFAQKLAADKVFELDINRPSIHAIGALLALDPSEMEFLALKAPLILFILDRRLTKGAGNSLGMNRIITKLLVNAKSGDLANAAISSAAFTRLCEKMAHIKLEPFFNQWVYGAGCPSFTVKQSFNKKKLVVSLEIQQIQGSRKTDAKITPENFLREVKEENAEVFAGVVTPVFTGPMTIRIHEADGTPYEHIVEIREATTRFEIPYNTKYKRLKRSKRQKERAAAASGVEVTAENQDDVLLYCLGDILQSQSEVDEWNLTDWNQRDEDNMAQEAFEWIRVDADFEWIARIRIAMPAYMFVSQLQQDRDVVAQYESIRALLSIIHQNPHKLPSTVFVRTLMDKRYFHGIRTAAADALARLGVQELEYIGLFHLQKAFQELFCLKGGTMPRSNDFSNREDYIIQCAIPKAIAKVRDPEKKAPLKVKRFLVDQLKFNDNKDNEYSDAYYVSSLMEGLAECLSAPASSGREGEPIDAMDIERDLAEADKVAEEMAFIKEAIDEIERYKRLDEWIPSYQNILSTTALQCMAQLVQKKVIPRKFREFLAYTRWGMADEVKLQALECLVRLGALRNPTVMKFFLGRWEDERSPFVRQRLYALLGQGLGMIAVGDKAGMDDEKKLPAVTEAGLVVEQEGNELMEARQQDIARVASVAGAIEALRREVQDDETLKTALWRAVIAKHLSVREVKDLLDICAMLYEPISGLVVRLQLPRYWKVENLGEGKVVFKKTDKVRTKITKPWQPPQPDRNASPLLPPPAIPAKPREEMPAPPKRTPSIVLKLGQKRESVANTPRESPVPTSAPPVKLDRKPSFSKASPAPESVVSSAIPAVIEHAPKPTPIQRRKSHTPAPPTPVLQTPTPAPVAQPPRLLLKVPMSSSTKVTGKARIERTPGIWPGIQRTPDSATNGTTDAAQKIKIKKEKDDSVPRSLPSPAPSAISTEGTKPPPLKLKTKQVNGTSDKMTSSPAPMSASATPAPQSAGILKLKTTPRPQPAIPDTPTSTQPPKKLKLSSQEALSKAKPKSASPAPSPLPAATPAPAVRQPSTAAKVKGHKLNGAGNSRATTPSSLSTKSATPKTSPAPLTTTSTAAATGKEKQKEKGKSPGLLGDGLVGGVGKVAGVKRESTGGDGLGGGVGDEGMREVKRPKIKLKFGGKPAAS